MAKQKKVKRLAVPAPQNLNEAAEFIRFIGEKQRQIDKIQSALNQKIERLKTEAMEKVQLLDQEISQKVDGLFAFAQANRSELTQEDKHKTIELPTGSFSWRMTPPAVFLKDAKKVLVRFKVLGLTQFIRTKEEINKEAILKEPEIASQINGITIKQREEFVVKPSEIQLEITTDGRKLRKKTI